MLKDKKIYLYSLVTVLFFGIFLFMQYAPDTYYVFSTNVNNNIEHFCSCGRFVTAIFMQIFMGVLNLSDKVVYSISYIIAIICTILSMYTLDEIIKEDVKKQLLKYIIVIFTIVNIFSLELFFYLEKGILMLSVLLCILAVRETKKFLEGNKKSIILALILLIVANCCYQGTVGIYVAISLVYILKYSKTIKKFILNNIIVALTYGIPALMNFIIVRFFFANSRVKGNIVLLDSMKKIYKGIKDMIFGSYNIFPKYLFAIVIIVLCIYIVVKIINKKQSIKSKIVEMLGIIYIGMGTICVTIAPQLLQDTDSIWFVARSTYPVASLIGILLLYASQIVDIDFVQNKIIIIISVIILSIQCIYFMKYEIDNIIVNYMDREQIEKIYELITNYEDSTGKKVEKIAIYEDSNPNYTYKYISSTGDMNIKSLWKDWSAIGLINYYTNRNLELISKDEEIQNQFKNNNWNNFSEEQLVFDNDTLHICTY